ncbi:MAG: DMT family transporter [Shewanella sp.]|uniref:DMT family transporter n=1 Tax=Shewanella sp. SNU WT4 TaxID=2590015 RepID=UPI00112B41B8|nr:DMT family transporter [Shewanella sp. SNU WT4]QDF68120.1 DMT family transporter [Shewanella sp. SNU WT4]
MNKTKINGLLAAFGAATLMGFVGFFARHINAQGDVIAFSRMLCGAVLFFFILLGMGRLKDLTRYRISPSMVFSGIFMGTCLSAYIAATQLTSIANAVFFIYIGPIISTILAIIFLKEPFKPITMFAISIVFAGMMLIVGLVQFNDGAVTVGLSFDAKTFAGDMLALASGVGYGLFLFLGRYRQDVPSDVRSFWNFLFALVGIGALFIFSQPTIAQMTASDWMWWIAIGIVCGFGALTLCTIATKNLLAVEFATISYWECVVASLIGIVVFSEPLSTMQFVGGFLIILGGTSEMAVNGIKGYLNKQAAAAKAI